jgi:rubrerythrin
MNIICPSCGEAGDQSTFHEVGQKKLLCMHCKAVLKIALNCPTCDGIIEMPDFMRPKFYSILGRIPNFLFRRKNSLKCPFCDYSDGYEKFTRIVVFEGGYSIIY